jgi:ribonuclease HII
MVFFANYDIEDKFKALNYKYIVGIDEVGRGSLCGPVTSAAVRIPEDFIPELYGKVKDSKKLSAKKRDYLYDLITENCDFGIGMVGNKLIDEINILEATKISMKKALNGVNKKDYALVDGNVVLNNINIPQTQIINGDVQSISIAAASIIAKVTRDDVMMALHSEFPIYDWYHNKGYGTAKHIDAIRVYGPCKYHRFSFNKVK